MNVCELSESDLSNAMKTSESREQIHADLADRMARITQESHPDRGALQGIIAVIITVRYNHSRVLIPFIDQLIARQYEEEVAGLLTVLLERYPLAGGYFDRTLLLKNEALKQPLLDAHMARLRGLYRDNLAALVLLSLQLLQIGQCEQALQIMDDAPTEYNKACLMAKAKILFWLDRFQESERAARLVLDDSALTPAERVKMCSQVVNCRLAQGNHSHIKDALIQYAAHLDVATAVRANLALGHYGTAFLPYTTSDVGSLNQLHDNVIDLEALKSKSPGGSCAVVSLLMGLGDEVRFASLIPEISRFFEKTILYCDERLCAIFSRSFPDIVVRGLKYGIKNYIKMQQTDMGCDDDVRQTLLSVRAADRVADFKQFTAVLRSHPEAFPTHPAPLLARADWVKHWQTQLGDNRRVIGLFWRSTLTAAHYSHKQSRLADWMTYLADIDIRIVPLQYDLCEEEERLLNQDPRVIRLDKTFDIKRDLEQTFALLRALPLVVSLPGTTQHMAGAVGTRVLCPTHPYQAPYRRFVHKRHDVWFPCVEIISGPVSEGLKGSIMETIEQLRCYLGGMNQ